MNFNEFSSHISPHRLSRYLTASIRNKAQSKRLYKANLSVSQSFYSLLSITEVILRNNLNNILSVHFADSDWILTQKTGFMTDRSLTYQHKRTGLRKTNKFLLKEVEKAEKRIRKKGVPVTSGRIIAEQTFSFWSDLFAVHHYRLLKGRPIQIFNHLPVGIGRKEVYDKLNEIRLFRNRIYHNEPVCFVGNAINFYQCEKNYQNIVDILNWIEPNLIKWVKSLDSVNAKLKTAKKQFSIP
jgi:hypothetical protein